MFCPDPDAMETAALWLEHNEGEGEEGEACKHVATWLREYSRKNEERAAARALGCAVRYVRFIADEARRAEAEGRG